MKKFKFKAALVVSLISAGAASAQTAPSALSISGFVKTRTSETFSTYQFRDEKEFVISNTAFSSYSNAKAFCAKYPKHHLAKAEDILLIAMSGAPTLDETLNHSISFDYENSLHKSGIVAWISPEQRSKNVAPNADIFTVEDGRGLSSETASLAAVNKDLKFAEKELGQKIPALKVHAVCVQDLKPAEKE